MATPSGLRDDNPPLVVEEEPTRHDPAIEGPSEPVQTRSRAKGKAPQRTSTFANDEMRKVIRSLESKIEATNLAHQAEMAELRSLMKATLQVRNPPKQPRQHKSDRARTGRRHSQKTPTPIRHPSEPAPVVLGTTTTNMSTRAVPTLLPSTETTTTNPPQSQLEPNSDSPSDSSSSSGDSDRHHSRGHRHRRRRPRYPFETLATTIGGRSQRSDRPAKIDPLGDGKEPTFKQWKASVQGKLELHDEYFATEKSRMYYVWDNTETEAKQSWSLGSRARNTPFPPRSR